MRRYPLRWRTASTYAGAFVQSLGFLYMGLTFIVDPIDPAILWVSRSRQHNPVRSIPLREWFPPHKLLKRS